MSDSQIETINQENALQIVKKLVGDESCEFTVFPEIPEAFPIYQFWDKEIPVWFIILKSQETDQGMMLQGSRVFVVSKKDGSILYDGNGNDEG